MSLSISFLNESIKITPPSNFKDLQTKVIECFELPSNTNAKKLTFQYSIDINFFVLIKNEKDYQTFTKSGRSSLIVNIKEKSKENKNEKIIFETVNEQTEEELNEILASESFQKMKNIRIVGLMGMATFTESQNQIKKEFTHLKSIFDDLKSKQTTNLQLNTISMGMSGDYKLAIDCGSTMVRIGSSIFGGR